MACRACSSPIAHRGGLLQKSYPLDTVNDFKVPDQLVADGFDGQGDLTVPNDKAPEGALSVNTMTQMPLPRRGDVAKRSASEPWRGSGS
jgi:hypothetical protein